MKKDNGEEQLSKWTQQLHDKLAEHETAAPADLWADIESAVGQGQPRKARLVLLRRWAVAAAVAALMVGGGLVLFNNKMVEGGDAMLEPSAAPQLMAEADEADESDGSDESDRNDGSYMAYKTYKIHKTHETHETHESSESQFSQDSVVPPPDTTSRVVPPVQKTLPVNHPQREDVPIHDSRFKSVAPKRQLSLGLYAMNGFGTQDNSNAVMMADALAKSYTNIYNNGVSASRQAPIFLTGYEERQRHYQPIAFGLSVSYPLTPRLSLTSGVVYTKLQSEFTQTIHSQHIHKDQMLHYVGVPLGLSYRLWQHGGFSVYAAAGMQADWNVSTRLEVEGVEQEMKRDALQWSVNGSLGLQYNVLPQLALYAEPGLNYHFDNGGPVQNFFKDKPADLKLQMGVRIDLQPASTPARYGRAR